MASYAMRLMKDQAQMRNANEVEPGDGLAKDVKLGESVTGLSVSGPRLVRRSSGYSGRGCIADMRILKVGQGAVYTQTARCLRRARAGAGPVAAHRRLRPPEEPEAGRARGALRPRRGARRGSPPGRVRAYVSGNHVPENDQNTTAVHAPSAPPIVLTACCQRPVSLNQRQFKRPHQQCRVRTANAARAHTDMC